MNNRLNFWGIKLMLDLMIDHYLNAPTINLMVELLTDWFYHESQCSIIIIVRLSNSNGELLIYGTLCITPMHQLHPAYVVHNAKTTRCIPDCQATRITCLEPLQPNVQKHWNTKANVQRSMTQYAHTRCEGVLPMTITQSHTSSKFPWMPLAHSRHMIMGHFRYVSC